MQSHETYTPLQATRKCANISAEQRRLGADRLFKGSVSNTYKLNGKSFYLKRVVL